MGSGEITNLAKPVSPAGLLLWRFTLKPNSWSIRKSNVARRLTFLLALSVATFAGGCGDSDAGNGGSGGSGGSGGPPTGEPDGTASACGASDVTGGDSAAPCFSNVSDILGGQRYLLRTDDLMVNIGFRDGATVSVKNLPLLTEQLKANPQTQQDVDSTDCAVGGTINEQTPLFMRLGRIYNLRYDVVVNSLLTIPFSGGDCGQAFQVADPTTGDILHLVGTSESPLPRMALLDADLDGYDDIFSMTADNMQFHSPQDVDTPSSEMVFRAVYSSTTAGHEFSPRADPVSGDFNGDGAVDIAWVAADAGETVLIRVVSVCPAQGQVVLDTTCAQGFEIVPWTGTIDTGQTWAAPSNTVLPGFALAAADLDGTPPPGTNVQKDELVLIIRENFADTGNPAMVAKAYNFADDAWSETGSLVLSGSTAFNGLNVPLYVASGRLDGSQPSEQVVFAASGFESVSGIWVLYLDEELTLKVGQRVEIDEVTYGVGGVAMGRFDPPDASSSPTGTPELDFNQQIALLLSIPWCGDADDCKADMVLQIYKTDNATFTPELQSSLRTTVPLPDPHFSFELISSPLQAGDLQGRSLRLGPPEKATVVQTQIDTVLGMPPMHVDYITPPQASEPEVYNVSVFPEVFNTAYRFTDSTNSSATSKSTTSYTYSTKESFQEKVSYGVPDVSGVSVSAKQAATQKHKSTVASQYDTYAGSSYNLNAATVFDDFVGFAKKRMNIYSYPVIGHTVCPASSPDCSDDEKLPLHVQFSGVDNVVTYKAPVSAGVLEWYQPVNEPGTLFSYPGNLAQLEADQPQQQAQGSDTTTPRFMLLSTPTEWSTADDDTVALTWSQGSSGTNTVGSVSNHSFDASASVSGKFGIGGFGLSASASFDYNSSSSVKTLNSNTLKLDESDGVTLDLELAKSTNPNPRQDYAGASYIFGLTAPVGLIQDDIEQASDVTLPATGPLRVASIADMTSTDPVSSDWWPVAYGAAPDVALNHPRRWEQLPPAGEDPQLVWFNCPVGFTSSKDSPNCSPSRSPVTLDLPQTVAVATFYQMKGLFVTPGEDSGGPPTTAATLGDKLTLRARIYNYSLANMPDGTQVHVAFYAQPWDATRGQFMSASDNPDAFAPAVFIGEDTLAPIPAFCGGLQAGTDPCSQQDAPRNWAFAETTWDTGSLDSAEASSWKIWLVTWMEQGGALVGEIPGHGLTAIPDTNLTSLADVPIETYSNNLGFYNQLISLLPPAAGGGAATLAAEAALPQEEAATLRLTMLKVENQGRRSDEPMIVRVRLESDQAIDDVVVNFYDGKPTGDGILFDSETIPHLAADQPLQIAVPYRRIACVRQRLHVEAFSMSDDVAPAFAHTRERIRPDLDCRNAQR